MKPAAVQAQEAATDAAYPQQLWQRFSHPQLLFGPGSHTVSMPWQLLHHQQSADREQLRQQAANQHVLMSQQQQAVHGGQTMLTGAAATAASGGVRAPRGQQYHELAPEGLDPEPR